MTIVEIIKASISWLTYAGLGLGFLALLSFLFKWGIKYRLIGATIFTLLLAGSCWAFVISYRPPFKVEGALYAPIVYDNGNDLVIAQASEDFPIESIQPTLRQIAGNLKGGGRKGSNVSVRLRKIVTIKEGISKPLILGEVTRDIKNNLTVDIQEEEEAKNVITIDQNDNNII